MKYIISLSCLLIFGCQNPKNNGEEIPLARVNDTFLYNSDIDFSFVQGLSKEDSLFQVQTLINNWATKQLLIDGAVLNLGQETQQEFEQLVEQYKSDLYTSSYLEALVKQNIDTQVSESELKDIYDQNRELFILKEDLVKLRYINVNASVSNIKEVTKRFKRFNNEDKTILDSISLGYTSYFLNDSTWIKSDLAISKIKPLQRGFNRLLLKKPNFVQLKDSLGLYLMGINTYLERGNLAPLEYVLPTLKQIVINKRKLKLIKQLKSDIVNDAIKNKKFEIYN
ncbi:peptidyl-prolyl cis-trans isomerase [Flavobacteriaceae bacterium]|nr:peptidyl-prolyl cis-trans isomerase [Flavobacteriaceae bacterium]